MTTPPLPGMEDWVPEHEAEEPTFVEEVGEIWRIVGPPEERDWQGRVSARFRKPFYSTLKGAKAALHYFPNGAYIQKGDVTWNGSTE